MNPAVDRHAVGYYFFLNLFFTYFAKDPTQGSLSGPLEKAGSDTGLYCCWMICNNNWRVFTKYKKKNRCVPDIVFASIWFCSNLFPGGYDYFDDFFLGPDTRA